MGPHVHSLAHHSSHKYLRFRMVSSPVPSSLPPPGPHSEALLPAAAASTTPSGGGPTGAPCSLHAGAGQRGPWTATTGTQHGRQVSVHLSKARSKSNWWVVLAVQSLPANAGSFGWRLHRHMRCLSAYRICGNRQAKARARLSGTGMQQQYNAGSSALCLVLMIASSQVFMCCQ
jgi:hypothetical protein